MVSTIILAGGLSKRFGTDKKFYKIFGKTFLEHIYNSVKEFSNEIIVSISSVKDYEKIRKILPDVKIILDEYNERSPINGLKSCIKHCKYNIVALTPCDTPFINPNVYKYMISLLKDYSAVIPKGEKIHILNAIYKRGELLEALNNINLNDSVRKLIQLLKNILFIDVERLKAFDEHLLTFININSVNDLNKVFKLIKR